MADASGSSAGGSVSDFSKMGKQSMEAELSMAAGDTGVTDAVGAIGGVLNTKGAAMNAELKATMKKRQDEVDAFGKDIETVFADLGPEAKELGQVSYQKAQDDVYGLREAFVNCAGDKRCEGDVMVKLNETKTKHSTDAENQKGLIGLWEGELNEDGTRGESSADIQAMTPEDQMVMKEFGTNKTKRIEYIDNEEGVSELNHVWEIANPDYISEEETPGENPVITKQYTNQDLQDMIAIKETANGEKLPDLIQAEKEKKGNNQTVSDNAALKKAVGDMIPKTQQALRSWAYSNPAEQDYLDVSQYLIDHPILNGQYEKLGVEDTTGPNGVPDGKITQLDFIALEDKESIVKKIMNADDVNLSHEILTDIYASVAGNEISGAGNKEYYPERHVLPNKTNETVVAEKRQKKREDFYTMLSTDEGKQSLNNMTLQEVITKYELTPDEVKNGVIINGERVNINSFIAGPTKAKSKSGKSVGDYVD
tara:strand:- start:1221 stop:2663 length:1443 start_codon:yes stop_codon:yes gene_type:complete